MAFPSARREIDNLEIEQGHSNLDTGGHTHLVCVVEVVIGQEVLGLEVEHPIQSIGLALNAG